MAEGIDFVLFPRKASSKVAYAFRPIAGPVLKSAYVLKSLTKVQTSCIENYTILKKETNNPHVSCFSLLFFLP